MTSTLTERREALRRSVLDNGPEHFDMASWASTKALGGLDSVADIPDVGLDINNCGTTCCLAGHGALVMLGRGQEYVEDEDAVADYFGLDDNIFYMLWNQTDVAPGVTMMQRRDAYFKEGGSYRVADWLTVIDYLDYLIKS